MLRRLKRRLLNLSILGISLFLLGTFLMNSSMITNGINDLGKKRSQILEDRQKDPGDELVLKQNLEIDTDFSFDDGKKDVSEVPKAPLRINWHDYKQIKADAEREGPGEHGKSVNLKEFGIKSNTRKFGFNEELSKIISLDRSVADLRHESCFRELYYAKLPKVSVIIPFHQEALSVLERTFHSILNRTPPQLLEEIILVDDFSSNEDTEKPLDEHVKMYPKVKIARNPQRMGLMGTRMKGARMAEGEVVMFMDSHCEVGVNWLPPLLDRIVDNRKRIVCPMIHIINHNDFSMESQGGLKGAFDWHLDYKRIPLNDEDIKGRNSPTDPIRNPVMAGGLFAVDRDYFLYELDGYDRELDIWGGEQYDLSFKVWMCGGEMEAVPCSNVYHVYRKAPPYNTMQSLNRNLARVVKSWMGDYAKYVYMRRPFLRNTPTGSLENNFNIQRRLKCKSFDWYMEHIAGDILEHYPLVEVTKVEGPIRNLHSSKCLTLKNTQGYAVDDCDTRYTKNGEKQFFALTCFDDLRARSAQNYWSCMDMGTVLSKKRPTAFECHKQKGNQFVLYSPDTQQIYNPLIRQCLSQADGDDRVIMVFCNKKDAKQKWEWQVLDEESLRKVLKQHPPPR